MYAVFSFVAGLVFGIGVIVSEVYRPAKVLDFLNVAGNWDPSLALVAGGAIAVAGIAYAVARTRTQTLLGTPMQLPQSRDIDGRLALGSLVFGIGWGLAGFGPGPALVALGTGHVKAFLFVVAMIAGMAIYEFVDWKRRQWTTSAPPHARAHDHEHASPRHHGRKGH